MELRHLRYFVAVAEEEHFGRAADRLRVAQPALSRQVRDLEAELTFALFDRLPRGVRLNAAGHVFLTEARRILQNVEEAKRRAERIARGKAGTLRVGVATAVAWHGLVAGTFQRFRREQPDAELELHHQLSVQQAESILSGQLDAGFGSFPTLHEAFEHRPCARERMVLAVPKRHPLTRTKHLKLRNLRDLPFVFFPRWVNPAFHEQMLKECARGGLHGLRIVQEAADLETNLGLVQCGIGLAWVNESTRWHCPRGVTLLPVADMKVRLGFDLVWRRDNTSPLLRKFVSDVAEFD